MADKASYFYELVNPGDALREGSKPEAEVKGVAWSDDELKLVFVKLLMFATDMPERYKAAFRVVDDKKDGGAPVSGDELLDYD